MVDGFFWGNCKIVSLDFLIFIYLQEEFEEHAVKVKKLTTSPSNEDLLILYGLYKQATIGPVNTS